MQKFELTSKAIVSSSAPHSGVSSLVYPEPSFALVRGSGAASPRLRFFARTILIFKIQN